jgi:hypothetical protein
MVLKKKLIGFKPLCYINKNQILISRLNELYIYDFEIDNTKKICTLELSLFYNIIITSKLLNRLFRLEFRNAMLVANSEIILVFKNITYKLCLINLQLYDLNFLERGLQYNIIENESDFTNGLYFGSYKSNLKRNKIISIYRYWNDTFFNLFNFPLNEIEHIHAVVPDFFRSTFWILTGDFNKAAAIWLSDPDFKNITPIVSGFQKFRSCVAFPVLEGLLYATDSQIEANSINLLLCDEDGNFYTKNIASLNGPCIYGIKIGDNYYFATCVEPYFGNRIFDIYRGLFSNRRADIIKEPKMQIVKIDKNYKSSIIYENFKDIYPFIFQFGSISFPSNSLRDDCLIFYNMASKINNLSTEIWNLND